MVNHEVIRLAGIAADELAEVEARDAASWTASPALPGRPVTSAAGRRVAVVVDDGVATGSTARAACQVARAQGAARVVLAVPVAPPGWKARMGHEAEDGLRQTPRSFSAVGQFYPDFTQTSDDEVPPAWRAATPVSLPGPVQRRCPCLAPARRR